MRVICQFITYFGERMWLLICFMAVFGLIQTLQLQSNQIMLHFIRHAQSKFNKVADQCQEKYGKGYLDSEEYLAQKFSQKYLDVQITQKGIQQAQKARDIVKDLEVDIVLVSPMRRALRTCSIIFEDHPCKPSVIVEPSFREIMQSSNDIGSKVAESLELFPSFNFDKITDKQAWFVQTLAFKKDRTNILNKLKDLADRQRREVATQQCMNMMKQNWFERRKDLSNQDVLKERVLPDYNEQKKVLEFYAQKYNKIAVVAHSECIKRYAGYKIDNCEIYTMNYHQIK